MQDTFCLKYNTQNVYKCIIKENQSLISKNKKTIRGIFTGWDNLPRYSSLQKRSTIFLNSNSFDFFSMYKTIFNIKKRKFFKF